MNVQKTYLFINSEWKEIGDIRIQQKVIDDMVLTEVFFPSVEEFVDSHSDEGAKDWFAWGPRIN